MHIRYIYHLKKNAYDLELADARAFADMMLTNISQMVTGHLMYQKVCIVI